MDANTSTGAISLQDQSFLYILSRVEFYPTSYLAMLPKMWRENLLGAVPPIQLFKLAKTDVALGIDVERIWKNMTTLEDSVWGTYFATSTKESELLISDENDSKMARFFNYINHLYFMEKNRPYACHRMRELLFSVHKDNLYTPLIDKLLNSHIQTHFVHNPPYYLVSFRCPSYSENQIAQMMVDLGGLPRSFEVNMGCVPWHCDTFCETKTSIRLLSSLRRVRLYCSLNDGDLFCILKQIVGYKINSLSTYGLVIHPNLESLELLSCSQYNIQKINPLFSSPHGYNHLRCLHFSMLSPSVCTQYLPGILKHQMNTLQELKLTNFELSSSTAGMIGTSDYILNITLSQFILQPQFRKLILDDFRLLPQVFAISVIQSFLRSIPNHKQTIYLRNCQISQARRRVPFKGKLYDSNASTEDYEEDNFDSVFHPTCTEECTKYKHLILDNISLPVEFLEWMCNIESIYLNTLILKDISLLPKLPPKRGQVKDQFNPSEEEMHDCNPWQMFDNHPNLVCEKFMYYPLKLCWQYNPEDH